jgi:hypothetical protein
MDTFGEIAEIINASTNWRCTLVGVRPSQSCNNVLTAFTATATGLTAKEGLAIKYNTADLLMCSAVIGPEWMSNDQLKVSSDDLLNRRSTPLGDPKGSTWQNELLYATATTTNASGTVSMYVYAVKDDKAGATELLLYEHLAATTVAETIPILPKQAPIKAPPGWRIIVQQIGSAAETVAKLQVHGLSYRVAQ